MSLSTVLASLNRPPLVVATGALIAGGVPFLVPAASLGVLQAANLFSFAVNVAAVSVPGRLDGQRDAQMRRGDLNPKGGAGAAGTGGGGFGANPPTVGSSSTESTPLGGGPTRDNDDTGGLAGLRARSLVQPSGWAFSIWGLIYMGEAAFCAAQFVDATHLPSVLPHVTGPFVAANLFQSLWCASFRPGYDAGWHRYVSVAMLGGTAYSLSCVPLAADVAGGGDAAAAALSWCLLPLAVHFGWTTAATLVNLNSSVAAAEPERVSDSALVALGHGSAVLATGLGVGLTSFGLVPPAYGLTVAWALLAVASNPVLAGSSGTDTWRAGAAVQRTLCYAGSALCVAASALALMGK